MIRDPSDGSVRELWENPTTPEITPPVQGPVNSGLPPIPEKADQLARLEKARDWLKNYLHRKPEATHDQD